jgi:hypothetical protein
LAPWGCRIGTSIAFEHQLLLMTLL